MKKESPFLKAILRFWRHLKRQRISEMDDISCETNSYPPSLQLALHRVTAWRVCVCVCGPPTWRSNAGAPNGELPEFEEQNFGILWSYAFICPSKRKPFSKEQVLVDVIKLTKIDQGLPYCVPEVCALVFKSAATGPAKASTTEKLKLSETWRTYIDPDDVVSPDFNIFHQIIF